MWYVIQTRTGEEERVVNLLGISEEGQEKSRCFVPVFEKVIRNSKKLNIYIRRLLPGYIFVQTPDPCRLSQTLRRVPEFTRILGSRENDGPPDFLPVDGADMDFLDSLLSEGILHVSYIKMKKSRIDRVIGPLSGYIGNITRLDVQHRRAIVEKEMFGKHRRICFGLWTDEDPPHPWIMEQMEGGDKGVVSDQAFDLGINPGDRVRGINGMYEDSEMKVVRVDAVRRKLVVEVKLFDRILPMTVFADDVARSGCD